ncbi:hypothetical protein AK812_SmicGene38960 [Symbiodinium microadriaticum]|uniref:Uncharacterized protein n=1 Tax=Symbiodinium microadriaticum TaxID=2951 RepID=A0A1Q9CCE5_SYMMI|nr:hypothetical protein AK812_SmicGene38960 [Symbiodinium microadriaticum]
MSIFGEFGGDAVVRIGSPCTLTHYINQEDGALSARTRERSSCNGSENSKEQRRAKQSQSVYDGASSRRDVASAG